MNTLYRIEQFETTGWHLVDPEAVQLTRERCDQLLQHYLSEGFNPNHLRAVVDTQ